jgi:ferric-dicitrate binding protein FerR (iron transport regulator)
MILLQHIPDEQLSEILLKTWNSQNTEETFFTGDTKAKLLSRLKPAEKIEANVYSIGTNRRKLMVRVAAAAAIVLVLSATVFFLLQKKSSDLAERAQKVKVVHDIAPGGDKALLTLADGRQIVLDTATNGMLAQQGGIKVIKIGGQLSYDHEGNPAQVLYNTVTTPRGGQYQLELADGSKVWLNAASSLRFPTAFAGKDRTVELTGEGYFEVAHDASKPFHVKVNDMDVQVLGTHFNINSYSDEPSVKTTLLEGRVMVKKKEKFVYLNPGQQAILEPANDNINVANDVDVEEVVAWKNGRFLFTNAQIETIMRQVARWYDVDVVYEKKINETFSGELPRSKNVSELLKMLEATGSVDFEISGKQIIVRP